MPFCVRVRAAAVSSVIVLALTGCRDFSVPAPPDEPGPGTVQGTVAFAQLGSAAPRPASGAIVELLSSSVKVTTQGDGATFLVPGFTENGGQLLFSFDADGDGRFDFRRIVDLRPFGVGPGRDVNLGQIVLNGTGAVVGKVRRTDEPGPVGHAGTAVFVPEVPLSTFSSDDGSFRFDQLPEGPVTIAFFRQGYKTFVRQIDLRAGEELMMQPVFLEPTAGAPSPVPVHGRVLLQGSSSSGGVTVTASGTTQQASSADDGTFTFDGLLPGVYTFGFAKAGYVTSVLINIPVDGTSVSLPTVVLAPGEMAAPDLDGGIHFSDAGQTPTDGGADAGQTLTDAGTDAGIDGGSDAGVDAGTDAGVDAGVDAGTDAGVDAGPPPPLAVIELPNLPVPVNTTFVLNAQGSTGQRPLTYRWSQDAGTATTVPNNNTVQAATPSIVAPSAPTLLKYALVVVDAAGRSSAPNEVYVPVGLRPNAVIDGGHPSTAYASQQILLDGTPSNDPSGTGIVSYAWSVQPPSIAAVPSATGRTVTLTMPSTVTTPTIVTATLQVVNGLNVQSNPATAQLTLTNVAAPTWYADAGAPQTVRNGDAVVIRGGPVMPPGLTGTFTYKWSPDHEPDAGPADWQLTDATAPVTTFVAPAVVGASRMINFALTVTNTSGLTPSASTAFTSVLVQDFQAPRLVQTSFSGDGLSGPLGIWLDFDEPLDPTSLTAINVGVPSGALYSTPSVNKRVVDGQRVYLLFTRPVPAGNVYTVFFNGLRDASPNFNGVSGQPALSFVSRFEWSGAIESTSTSTAEPRPALIVRKAPGAPASGPLEALLLGRRNTSVWALSPVDPTSCPTQATCALADDATQPAGTVSGPPVRGQRGLLHGSTAVATVQLADFQGTPAMTFSRATNAWAPLPAPPGTLFSDGTALYSAYVENGLKVAKLAGGTWDFANALVASNDATLFSSNASSDPLPIGQWASGWLYVTARSSITHEAYSYRRDNTGVWTSLGRVTQAGQQVTESRLFTPSTGNSTMWTSHLRSGGQLDYLLYGGANNFAYGVFSNVGSYDAAIAPSDIQHYFALSTNGLLQIYYSVIGAGSAMTLLPGVTRNSVVSDNLNQDPTCWADSPELRFVNEKLFIAWQERCGAGPWRVYLRGLY